MPIMACTLRSLKFRSDVGGITYFPLIDRCRKLLPVNTRVPGFRTTANVTALICVIAMASNAKKRVKYAPLGLNVSFFL
jgi:hypothetical protein